MKGRLGIFTSLLISLMFLFATSVFASAVAAKKDGVKIYAKASKKASVLLTLSKGQAVTAKERKGMYWSVKLPDGRDGYVSVLKVKRKAGGASSSLAKALRSAVKEGRDEDEQVNTRRRSAVMGVRGLAASDDTSTAGNMRPNLRAVYAMEDMKVQKNEIAWLQDRVMSEVELRAKRKGLD